MSVALPRVVRLGPLVGHLRDRRVIRSADKKCLRPRHVVSSLYRPWVLWRRCHDPVPHGRAIGAVYVPAVKSKFACLRTQTDHLGSKESRLTTLLPGFVGLYARPTTGSRPLESICGFRWARNLQPASLLSIPQYTAVQLPLPNMRIHPPALVAVTVTGRLLARRGLMDRV